MTNTQKPKKYNIEVIQWSETDIKIGIITKDHGKVLSISGGGLFMPLFIEWEGTEEGVKLLKEYGVKITEIAFKGKEHVLICEN